MSSDDIRIQPAGFLLQLSSDWIVQRASENTYHFLGESHVTLIDELLGRFVRAQPLHDLRNLFSRLSSTTGIARAYQVRLTEDNARFDLAFQLCGTRVLLEAIPSPTDGVGECIGSVGGLIGGLASASGAALLEGAARRMRALTAFDQVRLSVGATIVTNGRNPVGGKDLAAVAGDLPPMIADSGAPGVPIFPRKLGDGSLSTALLASPSDEQKAALKAQGIGAVLRVPIGPATDSPGAFECYHRSPRTPSFEVHAAAELFAQMFALRLEVDRVKTA